MTYTLVVCILQTTRHTTNNISIIKWWDRRVHECTFQILISDFYYNINFSAFLPIVIRYYEL